MTDEKRDQIYIRHMLECIGRIEQYATDTDKERFLKDTLVQDATLRVLQVMAESSQRLSAEAKESHPEIDWRGISGFRNILVHDYLGGIDLDLIWAVIETELPQLKKTLLQMR